MISDLLLTLPIIVIIYMVYRRDERAFKLLSLFLLSGAFAASMKLLFRVGRDTGIDPFSFPSIHTSLASSLFFSIPSIWTLLYAILVGVLRVVEGYHSLVDVLGGFVTAGIAFLFYRWMKEAVGDEADRKSLHMGIASLGGYFSLFVNQVALTFSLFFVSLLIFSLRDFPVIREIYSFYSRRSNDFGPITLTSGMFLASLLGIAPLAGFVLAYVDGLSALVGLYFWNRGKRLGAKKRLSHIKTIPGLVGGYVGSVITFFLLRGFYPIDLMIITLLLSPLIEFYSPWDDNLVIPSFLVGVSVACHVLGLCL